jgi:hypothetical protein
MQFDPVTGPLSREKLHELAAAPFGAATKEIRKHDPLWGLEEGTPIEWKIEFKQERTGFAVVKAATEKGALAVADTLPMDEIEWEDDDFGIEIESAEPNKCR